MLKKENILHWLFLITLCSFIVLNEAEENSILDFLFSTQIPLEILFRRWAVALFSGWFFAFVLSTFISIFHSIYLWWARKNFIKRLGERWKFICETNDTSFYMDLESFKAGFPSQAWVLWVHRGSDDFRFFRERETLCQKELKEVDCTNGTHRTRRLISFKGYGVDLDFDSNMLPEFYSDEKFEQPIPDTVSEAVNRAVCEENKKRGDDFANDITHPQENN